MDILERRFATGPDADAMSIGSHFDYVAQRWEAGHDHAHYDHDGGPLMFCGGDLASCAAAQDIVAAFAGQSLGGAA